MDALIAIVLSGFGICFGKCATAFIPVGFHFMMALKRPMASSSVHGSLRMSSSFLLGDCAAGVGVLCWSVAAGEVACDTRARFLGGICVDETGLPYNITEGVKSQMETV